MQYHWNIPIMLKKELNLWSYLGFSMDVKLLSHSKIRDPTLWEKINAKYLHPAKSKCTLLKLNEINLRKKDSFTIHKMLRVKKKFSSRHDDVGGRSSIAPLMLNITSSLRRVACFSSRLLTFGQRAPTTHWLYKCFGPKTCLDILEN